MYLLSIEEVLCEVGYFIGYLKVFLIYNNFRCYWYLNRIFRFNIMSNLNCGRYVLGIFGLGLN